MAARIARENKDTLDAAKSRMDAHIADWRAALSGQKERLKTLHKDASAMWEDLSESGRLVMGQRRAAGSRGS